MTARFLDRARGHKRTQSSVSINRPGYLFRFQRGDQVVCQGNQAASTAAITRGPGGHWERFSTGAAARGKPPFDQGAGYDNLVARAVGNPGPFARAREDLMAWGDSGAKGVHLPFRVRRWFSFHWSS